MTNNYITIKMSLHFHQTHSLLLTLFSLISIIFKFKNIYQILAARTKTPLRDKQSQFHPIQASP